MYVLYNECIVLWTYINQLSLALIVIDIMLSSDCVYKCIHTVYCIVRLCIVLGHCMIVGLVKGILRNSVYAQCLLQTDRHTSDAKGE